MRHDSGLSYTPMVGVLTTHPTLSKRRVASPLGFGFSKGAAGGTGYLGQHFSKLGQTFRDATARGVNEDTLTIPRVVFAGNNLLPRWEPVPRNIGHSRFHALAMLLRIRAYNLDLDRSTVRAMRDAKPGITGNLKRINGVRDYGTTEAKIILGNGVADTISSLIDGLAARPGIQNGLFNGVNAQIDAAKLASQLPSKGGLSSAR